MRWRCLAKYDDRVRVLSMGDFSTELCGGTHASRTGDIGLFRIVSESGTAAGVRRIEAVTGEGAIASLHAQSDQLHEIAQLLKAIARTRAKSACRAGSYPSAGKELQQLKEQAAARRAQTSPAKR